MMSIVLDPIRREATTVLEEIRLRDEKSRREIMNKPGCSPCDRPAVDPTYFETYKQYQAKQRAVSDPTTLILVDEADRLLATCRARRPDDPAVWRASLERAIADDDPAAVRDASRHLPSSLFSRGEVLRLRAWLAAERDPSSHAAFLERHVLGVGTFDEYLTSCGGLERMRWLRARKLLLDRDQGGATW